MLVRGFLGAWSISTGGREKQVRRLITLISADRNRIIVMRRELPRTENASWATKPYRPKIRRILQAVSSSRATDAAARTDKSDFSGCLPLRSGFGFDGNGPSKAEQFTGNGGHDLWFVFTGRCEFLVARAQAPLRLPGNVFDRLVQALLSFQQEAADPRFMLIGPGGFHHHPSQMSIAGFGNPASLDAIAAGILTRDQAAVAHQLTSVLKTAQRPGFGHDRHRRHP